jgi:hypothetical protein
MRRDAAGGRLRRDGTCRCDIRFVAARVEANADARRSREVATLPKERDAVLNGCKKWMQEVDARSGLTAASFGESLDLLAQEPHPAREPLPTEASHGLDGTRESLLLRSRMGMARRGDRDRSHKLFPLSLKACDSGSVRYREILRGPLANLVT